eukprot:CAMPEP_0182441718 /NCGR_PEP_ID=MMETSP1172-20130603/701_1 /TAXON_ID=708627 /ORGANISM="Timspurckia oligopyrenoides, Strain CCMP3278" /LENGTH=1110 /DNA_ID=CAMNT_0024636191 /DNA_START=480 /DNA_END=3812 /DNA_ORIENTATION=+
MSILIQSAFPFKLDDFQIQAVNAMTNAKSVIISAPTGSGKTLIGEAAILLALASGMRAFYTTPLKALSNQKFYDFQAQFGADRVGLLTGDSSINRDADVVVMTTEIYRNMLYAAESGDMVGGVLGAVGVVDSVYAVVLDEFHYMNDRDRGTVWEESVIISPPHIVLVALSATMANVKDVQNWMTHVHGPTELIVSDYRPVPLSFGFCRRQGLEPLFDTRRSVKSGRKNGTSRPLINAKLLDDPLTMELISKAVKQRVGGVSRKKGGLGSVMDNLDEVLTIAQNSRRRASYRETPSFPFVVRCLRRKNLLPAIIFLFSRDGCDRAAMEILDEQEALVNSQEKSVLQERVAQFRRENPGVVVEDRLELARNGIASHHAGMLPLWKSFVESLFQDGLIKVVFATETLAAGINMPARTTVISALSKRRGEEGHVLLSTSEVLQMAGRAGRRGKDVVGHSIILRSPFEGPLHAYHLVTKGLDSLESKFTPSYGMVLNLLKRRSIEDSKLLLEKSFGSYLASSLSGVADEMKSKKQVKREKMIELMKYCKELLESVKTKDLVMYQKTRERFKAERRSLVYLEEQRREERMKEVDEKLAFASIGTSLLLQSLPRKKRRLKSGKSDELDFYIEAEDIDVEEELMEDDSKFSSDGNPSKIAYKSALFLGIYPEKIASLPYYVAVTDANTLFFVSSLHIAYVGECELKEEMNDVIEFPSSDEWSTAGRRRFRAEGSEETKKFVKYIREVSMNEIPFTESDSAILEQQSRVDLRKEQLKSLEIHSRSDRLELIKAGRAFSILSEKYGNELLKQSEEEIPSNSSWNDFMSVVRILQEFGYIDENHKVTSLGKLGAAVRTENEIWLSTVLTSEEIQNLYPQQFAAALSAVISDSRMRNDVYLDFELSPELESVCVDLQFLANRIIRSQEQNGIYFSAMVDRQEASLTEAWASGMLWNELLSRTSLQEGDICRKLRRVMDALRQIPHLPIVSESLRTNARRALTLMDRYPVSDDITYSGDSGEQRFGEDEDIEIADGEAEMYSSEELEEENESEKDEHIDFSVYAKENVNGNGMRNVMDDDDEEESIDDDEIELDDELNLILLDESELNENQKYKAFDDDDDDH